MNNNEHKTVSLAFLQNIHLCNVDDGLLFLERLAEAFAQHMISQDDTRTMCTIARTALDYMKHRDVSDLLQRVEALERKAA